MIMELSKRAVSLMVSYTVLVVIAVSLSALVYLNLETLLPRAAEECTDEVQVLIKSITCERDMSDLRFDGSIILTVENRGRFNVDALFVRIGEKDSDIRGHQANPGRELLATPLKPGETRQLVYSDVVPGTAIPTAGDYVVEVQTAEVTKDRILVPCERGRVTQAVMCVND